MGRCFEGQNGSGLGPGPSALLGLGCLALRLGRWLYSHALRGSVSPQSQAQDGAGAAVLLRGEDVEQCPVFLGKPKGCRPRLWRWCRHTTDVAQSADQLSTRRQGPASGERGAVEQHGAPGARLGGPDLKPSLAHPPDQHAHHRPPVDAGEARLRGVEGAARNLDYVTFAGFPCVSGGLGRSPGRLGAF